MACAQLLIFHPKPRSDSNSLLKVGRHVIVVERTCTTLLDLFNLTNLSPRFRLSLFTTPFSPQKVLYKRHLKAVILTSVIHGSSFRGQINLGLILDNI